jgi:hypothetical protein
MEVATFVRTFEPPQDHHLDGVSFLNCWLRWGSFGFPARRMPRSSFRLSLFSPPVSQVMSIISDPFSKVLSVFPITNRDLYTRSRHPCIEGTCPQNTLFSLLWCRDFHNIGLPFWGTSASIYPYPCSDFTGYRSGGGSLPRSPSPRAILHAPAHPAAGLRAAWWRRLGDFNLANGRESLWPFWFPATDQNPIADGDPNKKQFCSL